VNNEIVPAEAGRIIGPTPPGYFPADTTTAALEQLKDWVTAASSAAALVAPLIDTPFIPASLIPKVDPRATPEEFEAARKLTIANATGAVLQGLTLGLDPMTSLQQIYIVHGRPGMYAKMMVALVQSKGHEVWTEDLTDTRAVVCGRRRGTQHIERITVTMDMARRAGWVASNKSYGTVPQDMLWARAAGRVCDRIASDVIRGVGTVEQATDEAEQPAGSLPGKPRRTTVRPPRPVAEEPELEPDAPQAITAAPQPEILVSRGERRRILALMTDLGIRGRAKVLPEISRIIGRKIGSTSELRVSEGHAVISNIRSRLESPAPAPAPETETEPEPEPKPAIEQTPQEDEDPTIEEWPVVAEAPGGDAPEMNPGDS
jgi:hypothetical protein